MGSYRRAIIPFQREAGQPFGRGRQSDGQVLRAAGGHHEADQDAHGRLCKSGRKESV